MRKAILAALAALLLCGQSPVLNGFPPGVFQSRAAIDAAPAASYTGPGDIVSGATAWWGLRGYNAAYSGNAANICLPLDATCTDIAIVSGNLSLAALTTLGCNNTTAICTVKTLYDQTGNGKNATNATIANRPILVLSCIGSLPCARFAGGNSQVLSASALAAFQPFTLSHVITFGASPANTGTFGEGAGNLVFEVNATPAYRINATGTSIGVSISASTSYAVQAVFNGASSNLYIAGNNTGDIGTANGSTPFQIGYNHALGQYFTGNFFEAGYWGSAFSSGNNSSMNSNQHSYWGF